MFPEGANPSSVWLTLGLSYSNQIGLVTRAGSIGNPVKKLRHTSNLM